MVNGIDRRNFLIGTSAALGTLSLGAPAALGQGKTARYRDWRRARRRYGS